VLLPFQGAPYNQAIRVGDLVFVAGQLGISLETGALAGAGVTEQTEQIMANLGAILDAGGRADKLVKTTVFPCGLGDFAADERGTRGMYDVSRPASDGSEFRASERRAGCRVRGQSRTSETFIAPSGLVVVYELAGWPADDGSAER
jgi:2-iminobutanoate/2-iminopropanoate deaminase